MARLNRVWKRNSSFQTKFQLFKSLVVSILLYGCETWTLLADDEKRIQAFETKCLRKVLHISYREHKTNDYVDEGDNDRAGPTTSSRLRDQVCPRPRRLQNVGLAGSVHSAPWIKVLMRLQIIPVLPGTDTVYTRSRRKTLARIPPGLLLLQHTSFSRITSGCDDLACPRPGWLLSDEELMGLCHLRNQVCRRGKPSCGPCRLQNVRLLPAPSALGVSRHVVFRMLDCYLRDLVCTRGEPSCRSCRLQNAGPSRRECHVYQSAHETPYRP